MSRPDSKHIEIDRIDVGRDRNVVVGLVDTPGFSPALQLTMERVGRNPFDIFVPGRYVEQLEEAIEKWRAMRKSVARGAVDR